MQGVNLASQLNANLYLSILRFLTSNRNMTKNSFSKGETIQHAIDFVPTAIFVIILVPRFLMDKLTARPGPGHRMQVASKLEDQAQ